MKRNLFFNVLFWTLVLFSWPGNLFAQKADTVTVVAPMPGDLYKFIEKDTLANGSRVNPNRYYRLERGKVYVVNGTMYFRYHVNLIADNDDPKSPKRPPMLVNGKLADGSNNTIMVALMKNKTKVLMKNIFFQGVSTTRKQGDDNNAISIGGDSIRLTVDNCVFNAIGVNSVVMWGQSNKLYFRNNIFRNLVQAHPFKGQLISNSGAKDQDTLIMTNNTSFNNNSYFWAPLMDIVKYEKIEHNTLYTSMVNVFYSPWMVNAEIRSNVFYGMLAYGQAQNEISGGWYDFKGSVSSVISIDKISTFIINNAGLTEAGRKIHVSNNDYFWPQKMKDYWAQNPELTASDLWMNSRTLGMFSDKTKYPNLIAENNLSVDPTFEAGMEKIVVDSVVAWVNNMRKNSKSTFRNYNLGSTDLLLPPWPLPEKLAYANTQLMTAGHDGLPVGDLNWFPEAKKKWDEMNALGTGVEAHFQLDKPNLQLTNYPNPTSQFTNFSFNLTVSGNTVLRIFNLQGKQVATLVNAKLEKGTHTYEFDSCSLPPGVYLCQLKLEGNSTLSKMIVTK